MSGTQDALIGGSSDVGQIKQFPYGPPNAKWMLCDNSKVLRSAVAGLSALVPAAIGTLTPTTRTPGSTPSSNACASDGTSWVLAGAVGTSAIQTTTAGTSFTARTTPASTDIRSILHLSGNNFAALDAAAAPLYSADGGATWTAATGGAVVAAGALQCCACYSPSLGSGSGRVLACTGSASVITSDDYGHTYTSRATGLGVNLFNVAWTGSRFIATTSATDGSVAVSNDGITWTLAYAPLTLSAATAVTSFIASDGAGRAVITWNASVNSSLGVLITQDSGATWQHRILPSYAGSVQLDSISNSTYPSYTNGLFFLVSYNNGVHMSTDLKSFSTITDVNLTTNNALKVSVTSNNGIYMGLLAGISTCFTYSADLTKIYLPGQIMSVSGTTATTYNLTSHPQYIKVN